MEHGSPQYVLDDELRQVSNALHYDLGRIQTAKAEALRSVRAIEREEHRVRGMIEKLDGVRTSIVEGDVCLGPPYCSCGRRAGRSHAGPVG